MSLFVILFFDELGDSLVRNIWQAFSDHNISESMIEKQISPHLTLGKIPYEKQKDFSKALETFAKDLSPIPVNMPHYGIFTSPAIVIFLGVTVTDNLYNLHRKFYQQFKDYLELESLYSPSFWIPHVTLAHDLQPEQISRAIASCQHVTLPIMTQVNRIALVESDPIEVLALYVLG